MHRLDEEIGDLDAYIKDKEKEIADDLEEDVLDYDFDLREIFSALSELECILSFADVALDRDYVRPMVVDSSERCIHIKDGAHPLQEALLEDEYVRNNAAISGTSRVNVITGPNYSGKSCYARQVGVLTYMAHIGCFIPCSGARISVVDRILAQFSSVETCAVPQSSFQLDLTRMGAMMHSAGEDSLVLIDEFGKGTIRNGNLIRECCVFRYGELRTHTYLSYCEGTSPSSGIALLTAALKKFSHIGCKVLCTTHFLEIFSMKLVTDGEDGIKALQMAVQVPENTNDVALPLFRLTEGIANSSAGLVCAQMSGVKESVVERAREIVAAMKTGKKVQPLSEILYKELNFSQHKKEVIADFLKTDWEKASGDDMLRFREELLQI